MSQPNRLFTDGQALTTPDAQRVADLAAQAPDRASELLLTPGQTQKKIVPLLEETATVNPRLLVVTGGTTGTAQLQPCVLIAGVTPSGGVSTSYQIAATVSTAVASPAFAANSSGSTRYDLLYATIQYAVTTSETRKQKDKTTGLVTSAPLDVEKTVSVTLGIVQNVSSSDPLASLPADTAGSVYHFGLAMVGFSNGYAGTSIDQGGILQLATGGWLQAQRIQLLPPMAAFYGSSASEKIANTGVNPTRNGAGIRRWVHLKMLNTTPIADPGLLLDDSVDWRFRFISGRCTYYGSASGFADGSSTSIAGETSVFNSWFSGSTGAMTAVTYHSGGQLQVYVDSSGVLRLLRALGPVDATNGDLLTVTIEATDQLDWTTDVALLPRL